MNEPCYYRVSVKALVIDETGRFLLSREDNGEWELLGGGLDYDEDPVECLRREVREEAGLTITQASAHPSYFITAKRHNHDSYVANVLYEVKLKDLNFTPSSECQELKFFTIEEARKLALFPNVAEFVNVFDPALHV